MTAKTKQLRNWNGTFNFEQTWSTQEKIARMMCDIMGDEWKIGRMFWMKHADEILTVALGDLSETLVRMMKEPRG